MNIIKQAKMETTTLVAIFIFGLLVSFTGYALYTGFGNPLNN